MKLLIKETVLLNVSSSLQRFINNVSAPNISGTSVKILVPPWRMSLSEIAPTSGFAVIPENPSEPPHLRPITSSEAGTSSLSNPAA